MGKEASKQRWNECRRDGNEDRENEMTWTWGNREEQKGKVHVGRIGRNRRGRKLKGKGRMSTKETVLKTEVNGMTLTQRNKEGKKVKV